jgi:hypothetical protein
MSTFLLPLCPPNPIPRVTQADLDQITPPSGAITFNPFKTIPLPAPAAGDVELFTFKVPIGYDGIITGQSNGFINNGAGAFIEGSGDIVWRIAVNQNSALRYLKDCGAIIFSLGQINNYQTAPGGLRLYSGNTVTVLVTAPNTSGALPPPGFGQVFAGLHGWYWPR